jgi:hypothetical protein
MNRKNNNQARNQQEHSLLAQVSCSMATLDWKPISEPPTENGHYLVWVKDGGAGWADQACIEC